MFTENRRTKLLTLGLSCLGLFMVLLDVTIVNNALPSIQRHLGASLSGLQWIVDAYTLMFASLLLTTGALSDRQGRKRWFLIGLALFTIGSALCGLAPNLGVLVAARALQATGGAAVLPASLSVLTSAFTDPRERAQAIGLWAGVSGLSFTAGPLIGGTLVDGPAGAGSSSSICRSGWSRSWRCCASLRSRSTRARGGWTPSASCSPSARSPCWSTR